MEQRQQPGEPEPELVDRELDAFEALGMGPDLYDYREPYRRYLPLLDAADSAASKAELQQQCRAAARAIAEADFLLIGAGAGMGVDSGLAAYADVAAVPAWASRGHDYASLCRPGMLEEDPALFYGFWGHCFNRYRASTPHSGYAILRRWCTDVLPPPRGTAASNHWVYSSNVDGHFRRVGFEHKCLLELHGNCVEHPGWFCPACSAGTLGDSESTELSGSANPPEEYEFEVDPKTMTLPDMPSARGDEAADHGFGKGWPRCTTIECNSMLRPAVHMFAEDSSALLSWLRQEEGRYVEWECAMENDIVGSFATSRDGHANISSNSAVLCDRMETETRVEPARNTGQLVLLEVGCGLTVPSVRMEMECVLQDLTERVAPDSVWRCEMCDGVNLGKSAALVCYKCGTPSTDSALSAEQLAVSRATSDDAVQKRHVSTAGALLVRINPQFPQNPGWEGRTIEIRAGAREALEKIDAALVEMGR